MLPNIFAVIVTFNPEKDMLMRQFFSLKDQVSGFIYVNNSSIDHIKPEFEPFKNIIFIDNKKNEGLGKAQNQGIITAKDIGASHILLMDQDSIANPNMVNHLFETEHKYSQEGKKVGLVGPLIIDILSKPIKKSGAIIFDGFKIKRIEPETEILSVSYCLASGSLFSVNSLEEVGLINEQLFIDGLDLEWCQRAKQKGYEILLDPKGVLEHECGNGIEDRILSHSAFREYYICRNNIILSKTSYITKGYRVRMFFTTVFRLCTSFFKGYKEHFKAGRKGFMEGIKSKGLG